MDVCGNIPICAICLTGIFTEASQEHLSCTHQFHKECIKLWLDNNDTCPECREKITMTSFFRENEMGLSIANHIVHALQCLGRYTCNDTKSKIANWIINFEESVDQQDCISENFPPLSDYALADRFLRLSNFSIGPPYSDSELQLAFEKLHLEWDADLEFPKIYHKPLISGGDFEENVRIPGTKMITPPTQIESANFKRFEQRISTFRNFPCNFVNVNNLAAVGFYFVPSLGADFCKCAFCGVVLGNFYGAVPPRQLHSLFSPLCSAADMLDAFFENY